MPFTSDSVKKYYVDENRFNCKTFSMEKLKENIYHSYSSFKMRDYREVNRRFLLGDAFARSAVLPVDSSSRGARAMCAGASKYCS